ncbi:MAG: DUF1592 domain-containing protein [Planctomycetia bacterium]|nr:DUF1592 domain-containing protein [Planctomycetia bacterium]
MTQRFTSAGLVSFAAAWCAAAEGAALPSYAADVHPILARYCFDCHSGDQAGGGITLDAYTEPRAKTHERKAWVKVLRQLQGRAMPPADADQPAPAEIATLERWITDYALVPDCSRGERPGRVTVRRLNREEYNNTVRDLFGIDVRPADDFPSDDVGYGFDTIGDVLSLPPVLLDRFIDASDVVARAVIASTDADAAPTRRIEGGRLNSTGHFTRDFEIEREGNYTVRVMAWGDQAGPDPCRMMIGLDGKPRRTVDVPNGRGSPIEYDLKVRLEPGKHRLAVAFLNDFYKKDEQDPKKRDRNLAVDALTLAGPIGLLPAELPAAHTRFFARPIDPAADVTEQAEQMKAILGPVASRAFRRPATAGELDGLAAVFFAARRGGESVERAAQLALSALLVSPSFLFRIEGDPPPGRIRTLNDFELAARLSYFLWSSIPDDALFRAAARGEVHTPDQLAAQAERMLRDPKAMALVRNFAGQWLQLRALDDVKPDPKRFPGFDAGLRQAFRRETEEFFAHVVREDRSVLELLDADYTFVDERLAKHYGIPGVTGGEFRRVSLDGRQRGGLLGQASILTVTSNPTRTSPVKRGKWILENLFAAPPPDPPPNVPELDGNGAKLAGTLRQRMEQHRADPACASCHRLMDPLGFGLENYDAIGAWRDRDGDAAVDAGGELPDGSRFRGPAELRAILSARKDEFRRCLIEKLLTYGLGRGLEYYDACAVERIAAASAAQGDRFSVIVTEIVRGPAFRQRESGADIQ